MAYYLFFIALYCPYINGYCNNPPYTKNFNHRLGHRSLVDVVWGSAKLQKVRLKSVSHLTQQQRSSSDSDSEDHIYCRSVGRPDRMALETAMLQRSSASAT